jgi:hypothetical protein
MNSIPAIKPRNRWDYERIHPGPVGSVGDVLISTRLKSSLAGNFNWDAEYYGNRESLYGSSIQNGSKVSFNSGGGPARVKDSNWGGRRSFSTNHGWHYQDMVAPDRMVQPELASLPQYMWRNKVASVHNAKRTGNLFMPLPGGLQPPNGMPRGGQMPRVTDVVGGDVPGFEEDPFGVAPNFHPHLSSVTNQPEINLGAPAGRKTMGRINRS